MGCDMKETLYTIRWLVTGDVKSHLTITDVYREAFNSNAFVDVGFIVRFVNGEKQIIASVTKEESE